MKPIEFENGAVQIDAAIVADGLGLALPLLQARDARGQDHEPCRARDRGRQRPASPDLLLRAPAVSRRRRRNRRDHSALGARFRRCAAAEIGAQARRMRLGCRRLSLKRLAAEGPDATVRLRRGRFLAGNPDAAVAVQMLAVQRLAIQMHCHCATFRRSPWHRSASSLCLQLRFLGLCQLLRLLQRLPLGLGLQAQLSRPAPRRASSCASFRRPRICSRSASDRL